MSDELGQEDISALWGPQGNGLLEPAPRRAERGGTPPDQGDRLVALERELRQAMADVHQRLDGLERQLAALTESRRGSLVRVSNAIKGSVEKNRQL